MSFFIVQNIIRRARINRSVREKIETLKYCNIIKKSLIENVLTINDLK